MKSLINQVILITGSTDGLGKATAFYFAKKGARILLHGRDVAKGHAVQKEIQQITKNQQIDYYNGDFSSLEQVQSLAAELMAKNSRINLLINNAGIGGNNKKNEREFGKEGFELRFTVNYLAHFLLTMRLLPLLRKSSPAKIINVSSGSQQPIDLDDVMMEKNYSGSRAYAQSKLALIMFTFDLAAELRDNGIAVNCLHPASKMDTKLVRQGRGNPTTPVEEGVDTIQYVATSADTENITGVYFDHHQPVQADPQAYNLNDREKLKYLSLKLTQLTH